MAVDIVNSFCMRIYCHNAGILVVAAQNYYFGS